MAFPQPSSARVSSRRLVPDGLGPLLVVGAVAYLFTFLHRGWIPHDEGLLGQSADLVLRGALPHADFDDAYTGGLSLLYAALFRLFGTDLVNIRWLMWLVFSACTCCIYAVCRRYASPAASGLATCVAVTWSFPNYFAGLPSWWLTACALVTTWLFMRYVDTDRWHYLGLAALSAGVAVLIKQTGLYLVLALVMATAFAASSRRTTSSGLIWSRKLLAAVSLVLAAVVMRGRIVDAEGVFLFVPIAAVAAALWHGNPSSRAVEGPGLSRLALVGGIAAIPFVAFAVWYATRGHLWDLFYGGFILPRARLNFASQSMPPVWLVLTVAWPLLLSVYLSSRRQITPLSLVWWLFALALAVASLFTPAYQIVWQGARAVAAIASPLVAWWLWNGHIVDDREARALFMLGATTSWLSMNQFPFAGPIYFSYTVPLVLLTVVALATAARVSMRTLMPWTALLLAFAVFGTNRGYVLNLGVWHAPVNYTTALALSRAHLLVSSSEAAVYRQVVEHAKVHAGGGRLMAGPDCPEVYFLAGATSPTGTMYEFMASGGTERKPATFDTWRQAGVVVVNHQPLFSSRFDDAFLARLRTEFPSSERVGQFELRWR